MCLKTIDAPAYLEKILLIARQHKILREPGVHHIQVAHDDWCALLRGTGDCNCNPDVQYISTEGRN